MSEQDKLEEDINRAIDAECGSAEEYENRMGAAALIVLEALADFFVGNAQLTVVHDSHGTMQIGFARAKEHRTDDPNEMAEMLRRAGKVK